VVLWDISDPSHPAQAAALLRWACYSETFAVVFNPDGRLLATGGYRSLGPTVIVWDVTDPTVPTRIATLNVGSAFNETYASVSALAFSPDGLLLAASCQHEHQIVIPQVGGYIPQPPVTHNSMVFLWDLTHPRHPTRTATLIQRGGEGPPTKWKRPLSDATFTGHADTVWSVGFAPNGRLLATGGDDRTILLWDVTNPAHPRPTSMLTHHDAARAIAFNPDGRLLAASGAPSAQWKLP
jgi:WD40 repeat protein